jgi:hypothetical protein
MHVCLTIRVWFRNNDYQGDERSCPSVCDILVLRTLYVISFDIMPQGNVRVGTSVRRVLTYAPP